jgi:hypothetical protein
MRMIGAAVNGKLVWHWKPNVVIEIIAIGQSYC